MRRALLACALSLAVIGATTSSVSAQTLTPSSATFPPTRLGVQTAPQAFTLTGGPPPFGIFPSVAIVPYENSGFAQTNDCPYNRALVAPATCTINVTFYPILTPLGLRTATLNANGLTASLTGTALDPNAGGKKKCKRKKGAAAAKKCKKKR